MLKQPEYTENYSWGEKKEKEKISKRPARTVQKKKTKWPGKKLFFQPCQQSGMEIKITPRHHYTLQLAKIKMADATKPWYYGSGV